MKIPLENGNQDDGSSRRISAEPDANSGSNSATGIEPSGTTGESGAGSGALDLGLDDLPLGDGGYKKPRGRRKNNIGGSAGAGDGALRIGERRGRNRGGGSRNSTDSDSRSASARSGAAEEIPPSGDSDLPREIALDSLGKPKAKKEVPFAPNGSLTTEFIAEGFGIIFHTFAILLNDDEWKLPQEDATELADRAKRWAKQGSKSAAAFEKKLAKYEPMMMLIFGLFAVLLPRIIHTRDKRRVISIQAKAAQAANSNGARTAAPVQSSNGANAAGNAERPKGASESVIPFRRKDGFELFGSTDERTV
jgi:hypothetical protein